MFTKLVASAATVLVAVSLSLVGIAGSASALGQAGTSDGPIPYSLTTTALTLSPGHIFTSSSPTNDGNIKYIPLSQYLAGQSYTNPGSSWTVLNINFHIEQNAGFGASMIGKSVLPFDSSASGGAFRGTLPTSGYCIVWVQVDGYNEHFGEGGQAPLCTTPSTTADAAAAAPTIVAATCSTGQTLTLGSVTNATWGTVTGGTGPGSYSVTATATSGHTFADGSTTKTFTGSLAGTLSATDALPTPAGCGLPTLASQPSSATVADAVCQPDGSPGSGSITVGQVQGVDFSTVVNYFIDGKPVTQISTPLPAGTYTVTATPQGADTLDGPSSWILTIAPAATVCSDLKTLALTGTNEFGWIVIAIILLQLGVGVLAVRSALTYRRQTQHRAD